jgi:integrase/recombinase XerD
MHHHARGELLRSKLGRVPRRENVRLIRELATRHEGFIEYASSVLNHSDLSLAWYRGAFQNFRKFLLDGTRLVPDQFEMRIVALEEWVGWNRKRGISSITVNSYWRAMRAFFNDWEKRDGAENPFRRHKAPRFARAIPKALTYAQCRRILDATYNYPWGTKFRRERNTAIIAVMLYAGLRKGEVLRLRYSDVSLEEGTIRIHRGKGPHGGKDRMAYAAPELKSILQAYLRERRRAGYVNPEFFSSTKTDRGVSEPTMTVMVRNIRRAAGVHFSAHMLRHSFVTHLLKNGVPIPVAQELAGHSSITTTMGYVKVWDEDKHEQIRKMRFR